MRALFRTLSSLSQHALRRIDPDHSPSARICRVATEPTVTTAKVEHSLSGQIGKEIRQARQDRKLMQPPSLAAHARVLGEEARIVVEILAHSQ